MTTPDIRIVDAPEDEGGLTHPERRALLAAWATRLRDDAIAQGEQAWVHEADAGFAVLTAQMPLALLLYHTMEVYLCYALPTPAEEDDAC